MNNQGVKYQEGLHQLASQTSSLLTNKQVDQMESIIDKCIFTLSDCERSSFVKFLASFLKLFLHCPSNYSEVFYKKVQNILKDGFQSKSKSMMQEKYEALIVALFETAEKYFSPLFSQTVKSNAGTHQELIENIMSLNVKGGLNLKGFIGLLRKFVQKDHENNKIGEALGALKDFFNKILQQILEDIKKGNKIQENISFKLFFFNCLYEQITSKYDSQTIVFLKDIFKQQISKNQDQQTSKAMFLLQFLLLNQSNNSIVEMISDHSSNTGQSYSLQAINKNNFLMDTMSSLLLFLGLNHQLAQNNRNFLNGFLLLQKRRYKSLSLKLKSSINHQTTVNALFTSERSMFLEQFILELLVKMKIHLEQIQYSKISLLSLLKTIVCVNSPLSECLPIQEAKFPQILETNLFKCIQEDKWITSKAKIYLTVLYCSIFTNHFNDYSQKLVIQTRMFIIFREIMENNKKQLSDQEHFFNQLYTFMNFKASKSDYLRAIFGSQKEKENANIIKDIHQLFLNQATSGMIQQKSIGVFMDENAERLEKNKFTFQNILDLLISMLQQEQSIEIDEPNEYNGPFNQLSLILFDKINIRPKKINKVKEEISFLKEKMKPKPQFCINFCTKMYQYDNLLKSNVFFMKSVPPNELNSQKIMVNALRKYFGMYYNRINELVIRKWITNREYLTIWSLLLCNYKVKTIGEQLLKCGISVEEMRGFFNIQAQVFKDFLEYLMTKDKYKFKLALFNCGLQHRRQLIDYSLPQLLL